MKEDTREPELRLQRPQSLKPIVLISHAEFRYLLQETHRRDPIPGQKKCAGKIFGVCECLKSLNPTSDQQWI